MLVIIGRLKYQLKIIRYLYIPRIWQLVQYYFAYVHVVADARGSSVYDNKESLGLEHGKIRQIKGGEGNIGITVHEEHDYVDPPPDVPMGFSTDGCYDNPAQILGNTLLLHYQHCCHEILI